MNTPSDTSILESVLATFDLVTLTKPSGSELSSLQPTTSLPSWFTAIFTSPSTLSSTSPFLEDFLLGAASDCWHGDQKQVRSGIWQENDSDNSPHFFQATALTDSRRDILVISRVNERHQREQNFIQHAHDVSLHQRRLAKERERKEILLDCIINDLSSPLTTILMNIQHVEQQTERPDLRDALSRAKKQADRQRELIHSIAHNFDSELSAFEPLLLTQNHGVPIAKLAAEMLDAVKLQAESKNISLKLIPDPSQLASLTVLAEASHLARVFDNLLNSALQRSPENTTLTLTIEANDSHVTVSLHDQATTITPETKARLLDPFLPSTTNSPLSLYFCKMALELWGGSLSLDTPADGGNLFSFQLQKHRPPSPPKSPNP
ncbi:MAG: HAMP domain-containing sensor histidine kinase [Verrucomicrobiota bacterium]